MKTVTDMSNANEPGAWVGARMRILHTEASLGWGGQEIRILDEAEGISGRGHSVALAAPHEAPIFQAALKRGLDACRSLSRGKAQEVSSRCAAGCKPTLWT